MLIMGTVAAITALLSLICSPSAFAAGKFINFSESQNQDCVAAAQKSCRRTAGSLQNYAHCNTVEYTFCMKARAEAR